MCRHRSTATTEIYAKVGVVNFSMRRPFAAVPYCTVTPRSAILALKLWYNVAQSR